jgi:hypothetical protein
MDFDFKAYKVHSAKHFSTVQAARIHSGIFIFCVFFTCFTSGFDVCVCVCVCFVYIVFLEFFFFSSYLGMWKVTVFPKF